MVLTDYSTLVELESDDPELIPEILPVNARLSLTGSVKRLLPLFDRAASITPLKEVIQGTGFALLETFDATAGSASYAKISATDGSISISVAVDGITVGMEGAVLVPAKKIYDILKSAPTDTMQLTVMGNNASIRSGRAQWTVATPVGDSLPSLAQVDQIDLLEAPRAEFLEGLIIARRAVGAKEGRMSLTQCEVIEGRITACDGFRIHRQQVKGLTDQIHMNIPARVMDELIRALKSSESDEFFIGSDDHHLVFQIDQDTMVANALMVGFPDIDTLLTGPAIKNDILLSVDTVELASSVRRVRINSDPDYAAVSLTTVVGKKTSDGDQTWELLVRAKDRNGNTAQESLPCQFSGKKPKEVTVNHKHLMDFLSSYAGETAFFKLGEDTKSKKEPVFLEDETVGFTGILTQQMRSI